MNATTTIAAKMNADEMEPMKFLIVGSNHDDGSGQKLEIYRDGFKESERTAIHMEECGYGTVKISRA